jgi:hypothetical protein
LNTKEPYVLLFAGKIDTSKPWGQLIDAIKTKHTLVYLVTADKENARLLNLSIPILVGDMTMIKTAARVWPSVVIMNGSTIMEKQSYIDYLKK